jgi:branched-chain amino acid transport system permease protein
MKSTVGAALGLLVFFLVLGLVLPEWLVFQLGVALAKGLVVLGVVLLMRAGLVSFGQGLFFAASAYAIAFTMRMFGIQEAVILAGIGVMTGLAVAALVGLLMARYREIFFAMLSLAFSMILYGLLVKAYGITGGSDGMGVAMPTLLGFALAREWLRPGLYAFTLACVAGATYLIHRYADSPLGYAARAVRDNEVRVEYLGVSAGRAIYLTYLLAGALGGLGGALVALNVGHVDPQMAYWTTSGEFLFVALLGGTASVYAPLAGSIVFELLRTYAFKYVPYTWQMALGVVMLAIILFAPGGLWSLYQLAMRSLRRWQWSWRRSA